MSRTLPAVAASGVVQPSARAWRQTRCSTRGRRSTTVWCLSAPAVAPLWRPAAQARSVAFTASRVRHAVELTAACMLIVAFLAVAMFV